MTSVRIFKYKNILHENILWGRWNGKITSWRKKNDIRFLRVEDQLVHVCVCVFFFQ